MTSIFVIDDHPVVAQGIALTVEDDDELVFVGEAASIADAGGHLRRLRPDLVLLDVRIPGTHVVEAMAVLRRLVPDVIVLLFTADPRHPDVRDALRVGALAVVAKDTPPAQLRAVLRAAARGSSPHVEDTSPILTPRQHDVLTRVATGMTNAEIAEELGLRPTTVKTYWQETMQRLGVRNRAEAIGAAYRDGLL